MWRATTPYTRVPFCAAPKPDKIEKTHIKRTSVKPVPSLPDDAGLCCATITSPHSTHITQTPPDQLHSNLTIAYKCNIHIHDRIMHMELHRNIDMHAHMICRLFVFLFFSATATTLTNFERKFCRLPVYRGAWMIVKMKGFFSGPWQPAPYAE